MTIAGSNQLPLRLCSIRWLEDAHAAERAIAIWMNIVKYIKKTLKGPTSKVPKFKVSPPRSSAQVTL